MVVQANRHSVNPTPLTTISQPNHGRKTRVLRIAQPENAAKLPMLTQALANPAEVQIRVHSSAPLFKLYLINETELSWESPADTEAVTQRYSSEHMWLP